MRNTIATVLVVSGLAALAMGTARAPSIQALPADAAAAGEEPAGKQAFLAAACNTCHSVPGAGIEAKTKSEKVKGPDLPGIAAERPAEWVAAFVKGEEAHDGVKHKKPFKGSDADLAVIIAWLKAQEGP